MNWTGQHKFGLAHERPFVVDGVKAGIKKNHGPLSFVKVFLLTPVPDQICTLNSLDTITLTM